MEPGNGEEPVSGSSSMLVDLCGEAGAQVVGFPLDAHERAGGLLAGQHLGGMPEGQGGLDDVRRVTYSLWSRVLPSE